MCGKADDYLERAREAKEAAAMRQDKEMRELLLSLAGAYELLARVQRVVDDPVGIYQIDAVG
jgi:hypothetical protein